MITRLAHDHALSGAFLYIKRRPLQVRCIFLPSSKRFDTPSFDFCSFLLLFLCFSTIFSVFFYFSAIFFYFSAVMDFPHVPEDLGDDLGAGAGSFSLDDFNLDDASFRQTVAETSSAAGPSRVSGGSSSYPRLPRGDPIPVTYNLETHAWITHRHPVSFSFVTSCYLLL